MEFLALFLIFFFSIGASVYLLICVNPNSPGLLGKMNRIAFKFIPKIFTSVIKRLFGESILSLLGGIKHYLLYTNHPIVQIFYLLITVGGFILYQILGIFKHMPNSQVSIFQIMLANILALTCYWVYYKSCAVGPGEITKQNNKEFIQRYKKYYDGEIFKRNNQCRTCQLVRPARSKHCSVCRICVSKHDHHCVWIRQCVGEKNYKYFVAFLMLHSIWGLFLALIGARSLLQYLNNINYWAASFDIGGVHITRADHIVALQYLFMTETTFFFLIVMSAILGGTLFIYVVYQFYLISKDLTTSERIKKNHKIDYLSRELRAINRFQRQFHSQIKTVDFQGQQITKEDLYEYKEQCKRKKQQFERVIDARGFFVKIEEILKL